MEGAQSLFLYKIILTTEINVLRNWFSDQFSKISFSPLQKIKEFFIQLKKKKQKNFVIKQNIAEFNRNMVDLIKTGNQQEILNFIFNKIPELFVHIDLNSFNILLIQIEEFLKIANLNNKIELLKFLTKNLPKFYFRISK